MMTQGQSADWRLQISKVPFYAIWEGRFQENTMGGLVNDNDVRVLREDGSVIPGLYAVGNCCRGVQRKDGKDSMTISKIISNLTWAVTSGFIAGAHAAEYMK